MKKLFIATICGIAPFAYADIVEVSGGTASSRALIPVATSSADSLKLDSTSGVYYSGKNNTTYKSVSVIKKEGDTESRASLNMAVGSLTLDANTASGDFDIITAGEWRMNHVSLTLKNSAADSTANLNVNVARFVFSSSDQTESLNFESGKYTVSATSGDSIFEAAWKDKTGHTSSLNVAAGVDVSWAGVLKFNGNSFLTVNGNFATSSALTLTSNANMFVGNGATMKTSGAVTLGGTSVANIEGTLISEGTFGLNAGSSLNIATGATLQSKAAAYMTGATMNVSGKYLADGNFSLNDGAVLNVLSGGSLERTASGSLTINKGAILDIKSGGSFTSRSGSSINIYGTFNTASTIKFVKGVSTGTFYQTAGEVTMTRPYEINSGSNWTVFEKFNLAGDDTSVAKTATVTINEGATFVIQDKGTAQSVQGRVIFRGYNNLILNKANAMTDQAGKVVNLVTLTGTKNNKLTINADQEFGNVYTNNADLDVVMGDSATLVLGAYSSSDNACLNIYNFQENSIYVGETSSLDYIKLYGATADDFLGTAMRNDNGFLTLIAVPEPAEWAMILGALALGLAVYRRRK